MRRHPVLVVEDDKRDLELTLAALERAGLTNEIVVVRDGAMAIDYLNGEGANAGRSGGNPAVVLLDLKLPKVDGLEVLKHIRSSDALRGVPVVMLTSSNQELDQLRSRELGVDRYIVKPTGLQQYVAVIAELKAFWSADPQDPGGAAPGPAA